MESTGFEVNPYNPCVVNKVINGKKFNINWRVDYLKLLHVEANEVTKTTKWIKIIHGYSIRALRGNKNGCLGMDLDFSHDRKVRVAIIKYLKNIIAGLPDQVSDRPSIPEENHLFQVRKDSELLIKDKSLAFHNAVSQILLSSEGAKKDLLSTVVFLATGVWYSNQYG